MKDYNIIKIEIKSIIEGIRKYTSDVSLKEKLNAVCDILDNPDFDMLLYFLQDIRTWYNTHMYEIIQNRYVSHKDTHARNEALLKKIIEELQNNLDEYKGIYKNCNSNEDKIAIKSIENIFNKFHKIVVQFRDRYADRPTIDVDDEYDVQDLLHSLLCLYCEDIRTEEWNPSYAGTSTRQDFLLKKEKIVIETKKTRKGLGNKEIKEQLLIDIAQYKKHPDCKSIICFIYDPENRIKNSKGFEDDFNQESTKDISIHVYVRPL